MQVQAGSVGSLWAALFRQRSDAPITLILRDARYARQLLKGSPERKTAKICVERNKVKKTFDNFNVEWLSAVSEPPPKSQHQQQLMSEIRLAPATDATSGQISSLIVATKAGAVLPALSLLASRLSADSTIVLIQNGAGTYEAAISELFRDRATRPSFIVASTTHGCQRKPSTDSIHTLWNSQGNVSFMVIPSARIADALQSNDLLNPNPLTDLQATTLPILSRNFPSSPFLDQTSLRRTLDMLLGCEELKPIWLSAPSFRIRQLQKLVGNAVINPLTALYDVPNGALLKSDEFRAIAAQICEEAARCFAAQGPIEDALSTQSLYDNVLTLASVTAENISSTLSDIHNKAAETEV